MATMETEYSTAFFIPCIRDWLRFKKKVTVTGNMAYRHGCNTEINPQRKPSRNVCPNVLLVVMDCAVAFSFKKNKAIQHKITGIKNLKNFMFLFKKIGQQ